jgi:hypothetical protein
VNVLLYILASIGGLVVLAVVCVFAYMLWVEIAWHWHNSEAQTIIDLQARIRSLGIVFIGRCGRWQLKRDLPAGRYQTTVSFDQDAVYEGKDDPNG